jgi:hypothetical protein
MANGKSAAGLRGSHLPPHYTGAGLLTFAICLLPFDFPLKLL